MGEKTSQGNVGKAIIGAFAVTLFVKVFVFDIRVAEGHSMYPAIRPGTILLVSKISYGIRLPGASSHLIKWRTPMVGEVLVFFTPLGEIAVKRCAEILPGGYFYALGDNSEQSYDSRDYGPVPFNNIIGRVLGVR